MRSKGKLTTWNDDKGFGFITPMTGGERIFIHVSAFPNRNRRPALNQIVTYTPSLDKNGRPCAIKATLTGDKLKKESRMSGSSASFKIATVFLLLLTVATILGALRPQLLGIYLAVSLVTLVAYWVDKRAAQEGGRRTPENTLHLLALLGGWPGALVAQQKFRHKSSKKEFRAVFWFTVVLNCCALFWLLTNSGEQFIQRLIG